MSIRRLNAWLRCFAASCEYQRLLFVGWVFVAAAAAFFLPLRLLQIVEGMQ